MTLAIKYNPNQPRDPGGEAGGQWTSGGSGGSSAPKLPTIKLHGRYDFAQGKVHGTNEQITNFAGTVERKAKDGRLMVNAGTNAKPKWVETRQEHVRIPPPPKPVGRSQWKKQLSPREIASVKAYKGAAYETINHGLRNPPPKGAAKEYAAEIDKAIAKGKIERNVTAYRGMSARFFKGLNMKTLVGREFVDHGFVSVSQSRDVADGFARTHSKPVLAKIRIPEGHSVAYVETVASTQVGAKERELLMPRDTTFKIVKARETIDGTIEVELELAA